MLISMCPHVVCACVLMLYMHVSSCCICMCPHVVYACVLMFICMCPHVYMHVSSCLYAFVHMQICMCPYVDTCSYISVGVGTTSKILPLTTPATMILWVVLENFHTKKYVCPISIGWTKSLAQGASVYIALRQQRRSTKHA